MRSMSLAVLTAAAVALAVAPAETATKKKSQSATPQVAHGEAGVVVHRSGTHITVTRRSYLDPGTEVFPGSQNSTGYVFSPFYESPSVNILGPVKGNPTPGTSELWNPAYHVPNWGY
jgi:hypothetical protein